MSTFLTAEQLDAQISDIRANIRDLTEQAAARSGANDDEHAQNLIEAQQEELDRLLKLRDTLGT